MTVFDIEIYTDTICPWCYIGHRIFHRAIELYTRTYPGARDDTFKIRYLPFYLNPEAPPGISTPMLEKTIAKNGDEMARGIVTRLNRIGLANGIVFSWKSRLGCTRDSHRIIQFAGTKGEDCQKRVVERLYEVVFEGGMDVTSRSDLVDAVAHAGILDHKELTAMLQSDTWCEEVDRMAANARASGIRHVPNVIINGERIEGAEDASAFYEAFVNVKLK